PDDSRQHRRHGDGKRRHDDRDDDGVNDGLDHGRWIMRIQKVRRRGFTLLEMMLASGIALLLMAALYVSMEVNLNYASAAREIVDQSELARALLARIAADINGALTPITATKSTSASSGTVVTDDTTTMSLTTVTPLNMGVVGDSTLLNLYVSRVPNWTS